MWAKPQNRQRLEIPETAECCVDMSADCHKATPSASPPWRYPRLRDRKSTRLNSSHLVISYAVFCLKKKKNKSRWDLHGINKRRSDNRRNEAKDSGAVLVAL